MAVPALTTRGLVDALNRAGLSAVPLAVDRDSLALSHRKLAERLDAAGTIDALIAGHPHGQPARLGPISALCQERGLPLLEDASHAAGAEVQGAPVGSFGAATVFDLGLDGPLSAGGGALVVARGQAARRMHAAPPRLDPRRASIALAELDSLHGRNARRRENARELATGLAGVPGTRLQKVERGGLGVWAAFSLRLDSSVPLGPLRARLARRGVFTLRSPSIELAAAPADPLDPELLLPHQAGLGLHQLHHVIRAAREEALELAGRHR